MAVLSDLQSLKQALQSESSRQSQLAKAHEDLQLQHEVKVRECQRLKTEKEGLLGSLTAFHDGCAEETRMLRSLTESTEELATARRELAAAARLQQECIMLKAQNELLDAKLASQKAGAAAAEKRMNEQNEHALVRLQEQMASDRVAHGEQLDAMLSKHKQQVTQQEQKLAQEQQARQEAERKLDKERRSYQASMSTVGAGKTVAVASLKERMWALRSELETVSSERDTLKKLCTR